MSLPQDSVLSPNALVVVTGANGLVGSHVIVQLLQYGLRARGVVRNLERAVWMQEHFDKAYGPGRFELVECCDQRIPGALDEAFKGCDAVIAVASEVSFSPDPTIVVNGAIALVENILDAASRTPSVKRVVYTSSSAAPHQMIFDKAHDVTPESWNENAISQAWAPPPYEAERSLIVYCAAKAQSEQALFKFARDRKPHFVVNSVLPDLVIGAPLDVARQGFPSSLGVFKGFWDGDTGYQQYPPQYMIDAGDNAKLHLAALVHPEVKHERVFAYGHIKSWANWNTVLRDLYPDHQFPDPPPDEGPYVANITARPRAEKLLRWISGEGFRPMMDSVKDVADILMSQERAQKIASQ